MADDVEMSSLEIMSDTPLVSIVRFLLVIFMVNGPCELVPE